MSLWEIGGAFPWVRRHRCAHSPPPGAAAPTDVATSAHRSWVRTNLGRGWLHHHEADGYVIQLESGELIKRTTAEFGHIEQAP